MCLSFSAILIRGRRAAVLLRSWLILGISTRRSLSLLSSSFLCCLHRLSCCAFVSLSLGKGEPRAAKRSVGNAVVMCLAA